MTDTDPPPQPQPILFDRESLTLDTWAAVCSISDGMLGGVRYPEDIDCLVEEIQKYPSIPFVMMSFSGSSTSALDDCFRWGLMLASDVKKARASRAYDLPMNAAWRRFAWWLIDRNPHGLIWRGTTKQPTALEKFFFQQNLRKFDPKLLCWLTRKHSWLFATEAPPFEAEENEENESDPLHFQLLEACLAGDLFEDYEERGIGHIELPDYMLKDFYCSLQPSCLLDAKKCGKHKGCTVFHEFILTFEDNDLLSPCALFCTLARQCPAEFLASTDQHGSTPLAYACDFFGIKADVWTDWQMEQLQGIIFFLIARCPQAIVLVSEFNLLPIDFLIALADDIAEDGTVKKYGVAARAMIVAMLKQVYASENLRNGSSMRGNTIGEWLEPTVTGLVTLGKDSFTWRAHVALEINDMVEKEFQAVQHVLGSSYHDSHNKIEYMSWLQSRYSRLKLLQAVCRINTHLKIENLKWTNYTENSEDQISRSFLWWEVIKSKRYSY